MSPHHTGRLTIWNDDRGFGFIRAVGVRERIFVHIKDFDRGPRRPEAGDDVTFRLSMGIEGTPVARAAEIHFRREDFHRPAAEGGPTPMRVTIRVVAALVFTTLLVSCVALGNMSPWLLLPYGVASVLSFALYQYDKQMAEAGAWRVSELHLHALDLAFGIPGGLLAQGILRHKSSKISFAVTTIMIQSLHTAVLVAVLFDVVRLG